MATKEQEVIEKERAETIQRLKEKRDEYIQRLDIGSDKIEEAINKGQVVTEWEEYWVKLLRQYEAIVDKLRDLGYTEA